MVTLRQSAWSEMAQHALATLVFLTLALGSVNVLADASDDAQLREEMAKARQQLDEAAQRVAELSRKMAGDEVTRVVQRISIGRRKAMLGVRIDDAKDGLGVRIDSVTPEGPAELAGVKADDLLQSINGVVLTGGSSNEAIEKLLKSLRELEPGDVAKLDIQRNGRNLSVDVTTESVASALPRFGTFTDSEGQQQHVSDILETLAIELPEINAEIDIDGDLTHFKFDSGKIEELKQLPKRLEEAMGKLSSSGPAIAMLGGFTGLGPKFRFVPVTPGLGGYFGVERGVLLAAVPEQGGLGMQDGDVLLSINGEPVNSRHDVYAAFAHADEGDTLAVELVRQRESLTVDVTAPENPWGRAWKCMGDDKDNAKSKKCTSKDGRAFSFRFSTDDD